MDFTITFIKAFFWAMYLISPITFFFCAIIIVLGQVVRVLEKWSTFDALYWSFITATTVGYGDMRPLRKVSKILSVLIAYIGIMSTGILVAVTLHTASVVSEKHVDAKVLERIQDKFS